jgi:hypothetical protein
LDRPRVGTLIGVCPHERIAGDKITLYINPKSQNRDWILEIHFIDRVRRMGGFYEAILGIG